MSVVVPSRIRALPTDARGYPIPAVVLVDDDGKAHFTIIDHRRVEYVIEHDLCAICGQKLLRGRWLVGGPLAAFHPNGEYFDTPLHHECAAFALQVCPWLAMPNYTKQIGKFQRPNVAQGVKLVDPTMMPGKPAVFVTGMTSHCDFARVSTGLHVRPKRPWMRVEFWRDGVQLPAAEGQAVADRALAEFMATPSEAKSPASWKTGHFSEPDHKGR